MEPIKPVKTEWVHSGIHAYMEQFRYAALNLIKNADEENKNEVADIILAQIREGIGSVELFLKKPVKGEVMQSLEFSPPVGLEIGREVLQPITILCEKFKRSILRMVFSMSNHEQVSSFPFIAGGIMRSILDMKEKVAKVIDVEEFEFPEIELDKELDPEVKKIVDQILSCTVNDAILFVMEKEGFTTRKELGDYLGVSDNVMNKFFTFKEDDLKERGKKSANKIRTWFKNQILKFASNADMKSLNEILRLMKDKSETTEEMSANIEKIDKLPDSVQHLVRSIIEFVKQRHLRPTQLRDILRILRKTLGIRDREQLAKELGLTKQQLYILDRNGIPSKKRNIKAFTVIKNWIINQIIVFAGKNDVEALETLDRCTRFS